MRAEKDNLVMVEKKYRLVLTSEQFIVVVMAIPAVYLALRFVLGLEHPLVLAGVLIGEVLLLQVYTLIHCKPVIRKVVLASLIVLGTVLLLMVAARFLY